MNKKKLLSLLLIASILSATITVPAFADEYAETSNRNSASCVRESGSDDADAELLAAVDGITFEYDYSASTELVRIVKVKYDQSYFTTGINAFNAEIRIPSQYTASVSYSTKLSGFNIIDSYQNGVYKCTGTSTADKIPADGALFTMRITLKENILSPFTISLTGNSSLGDASGVTQYLSNGGMNPADLEIPANINDVGDSGVDGAVTWEYSNGVLKLHGNGTMSSYSQGDAPWYRYADKIKSIEFTEENLQNIGRNAFYGLYNAETVILSADIRSINDNAFEGCSSLRTIEIPQNSGVGIGNYAFKNCSSLTSVYVPQGVRTIGRGAFEGCSGLNSVTLPFIGSQSGESNSKNTFLYIFDNNVPSSLRTVSITNETVVPESAFEGCSSIQNIYLNSDVYLIGQSAFKGCSSLRSFTISDKVTEINDYTFQGCSSITKIEYSDNIKAIGAGAFDGCRSLPSVYIPSAVPEIKDYTFRNCASFRKIDIPANVTNIGRGIIAGCSSLVDVKVPFIGANIDPGSSSDADEGIFGYFFDCSNNMIPTSVTKVEITSTDRSGYIPADAFKNCGNIEDIIIYGGRSILGGAFENCKNLRNLYIPKSISNMGKEILSGCTRLETLTIPFIGISRMDNNSETSVLGGFFGYNDDNMASGTMQYYNTNGNYHFYNVPKTLKNVSVLNQTNIPTGAFMECDFIENVSIVTGAVMNPYAFYHCVELKKVVLPNDLQTIGEQAFAECENLETVNIPTKVKTIGSQVFYNARNLKNVTMPDSIKEIAADVFNGVGLFAADEVGLMDTGLTITCSYGSEAYKFAVENGINTNVVESSALDVKNVGANISRLSTGGYLVDVTDTHGLAGDVYAAVYDAAGRMLDVKKAATDNDNPEYRFIFGEENVKGISYVKVFVWGDKGGMTPLTDGVITLSDFN